MSVCDVHFTEIAEACRQFEAVLTPNGTELSALRSAFAALHMANVMAYCLAYGGPGEIVGLVDVLDATGSAEPEKVDRDALVERIKSMLYNTVTNIGTECLPARHAEVINLALARIADQASVPAPSEAEPTTMIIVRKADPTFGLFD